MTMQQTRRRRIAFGLCALAANAGCGSVLSNNTPRSEFFSLDDLSARPSTSAGRAETSAAVTGSMASPPAVMPNDSGTRVLMLATGATPTLFDSDRMVYTRDGVGRSYYNFASWSERPGRRLATLAETRFSQDPYWKAVVSTVAGARGDLLLTLKLDDLTHDDSNPPGQMNVACTAELIDWRQHRFMARTRLQRSATVRSRDAKGAAAAANQAVSLLLDDLEAWTRQAARPVQP
jgi:cholesterol transport system auxiliary component